MNEFNANDPVRRELEERYLVGEGFEVGTGLRPSYNLRNLAFINYRDREKFTELLGDETNNSAMIPQAPVAPKQQRGFLVARHVIEHCHDAIGIIASQWIPLIETNGVLFLSLRSQNHIYERLRIPTPIEHLLNDYYFGRDEYTYETVQHIPMFVLQQTAVEQPGQSVWYADRPTSEFSRLILEELESEEKNLHWHTYTLPVISDVVETAFYVAGSALKWIERVETPDSLYLVCRTLGKGRRAVPRALAQYKMRLEAATAAIQCV